MSQYIDGFVIPFSKNSVEEYRRMAEKAAQIWKDHGALDYWECIGDDLDAKEMVSFTQLAKTNPDETVVFPGSSMNPVSTAIR
jgi:uncharacterized protein YbaA (DUF1428 family)